MPFPVYDTHLLGTSVNRPVEPSFVQSLDFRVEKYASTLDLFSFGLFYRDIRNPIERTTFEYRHDERMYILQNSDRARHYGFEIHVRKHLDFLMETIGCGKRNSRQDMFLRVHQYTENGCG